MSARLTNRGKRSAVGLLVLLFSCTATFAQGSEELKRCMSQAETQLTIHKCASDEAGRVDAELNSVYKNLLSTITADPIAVEKIKDMERAWVSYRDAYLEAMFPASDKRAVYGSMYTTDLNLFLAAVTSRHIDALRDVLKQYSARK